MFIMDFTFLPIGTYITYTKVHIMLCRGIVYTVQLYNNLFLQLNDLKKI